MKLLIALIALCTLSFTSNAEILITQTGNGKLTITKDLSPTQCRNLAISIKRNSPYFRLENCIEITAHEKRDHCLSVIYQSTPDDVEKVECIK